jgi:hypothetical protein
MVVTASSPSERSYLMGKGILTKEVLATIPEMVEQRLNKSEIAERLGCTPGTLQTQCCRAGISLRKSSKRGRTPLILSPTAIEGLRLQAHAMGCSEVKLATDLLEVIAKDELYEAVLDN